VSEEDFVKVGSKRVLPEKHLYILLHKPRGYLCTASDTHNRHTVFDLLPGHWPRLFHVGRLDRDSEGLLILTNDGDLGLRLTHPRYKMDKEYEVLLDQAFDAAKDAPRLLRGVNIEGGRAKAETIRQLAPNLLRIVLRQGIKRQIRLMLYKVGYEVKRLVRMRIGPLRLTELRAGEWRVLTPAEVKALQSERPKPLNRVGSGLKLPGKPKSALGKKKSPAARGGNPADRPDVSRPRSVRHQPPSRSSFGGKGSAASTPRAGRRP